MNEEIRYCQVHGNHKAPEPPSQVCRRCEDQLRHWLHTIPDMYAGLGAFIHHGTTDRNPESKATKRSEAAAPMRLEVIDLLDTRLGRKWQGTEPTDDRRGALGVLYAVASEIRDGRNLTGEVPNHVTGAASFITRHLLWLVEQEWVADTHDELRRLHRELSDAIGDYRPRPVGRCHVTPDDTDQPCGGPLLANPYGGVKCPRCQSTWDAEQLRVLGLAQAQETGRAS